MPLDNQTELFYLVDPQDNVLGSITRGEAHQDKNNIHRSIGIIVKNPEGELLLQKRSSQKDKNPNMWCLATSGHVTYGDEYAQTAKRELMEEIGVETELSYINKFLLEGDNETEIMSVYSGVIDFTPEKLDPSEVDEVRWVKEAELRQFSQENPITPMTLKIFQFLELI